MSKTFLTAGVSNPDPNKADAADSKFFDYQTKAIAKLREYGMKLYYAQLATIDFRYISYNAYKDNEPVDSVAVRLMTKAKESYYGKIMVADGPCPYSGSN